MKYTLVLVLCFGMFLFAKESPVVQPVKPKIGDKITITYDPTMPNAVHKDAEQVYVVALLLHADGAPSVIEQQMTKKGTVWTAEFTLDDTAALGMLVRFDAGTKIDDNNGKAHFILVYGKNNKPLPKARVLPATMLIQKNFFGFRHGFDSAYVIANLKEELKTYPNQWEAQNALWMHLTRNDTSAAMKERMKKEVERVYNKYKNDEKVILGLDFWFKMTGQKERAQAIEEEWIKKNPTGRVAENKMRMKMMKEMDANARAVAADEYLTKFAPKPGWEAMFLSAYIRAKQYDKAIAFLEKHPNVSPNMYNSLAWEMISDGVQLERAVALAKEGLERASHMDASLRLAYITQTHDQFMENVQYLRGMIADTYGAGLMKLQRYAEAEKALAESYTLTNGNDDDINARLIECYLKNGKNDKASEIAFASIEKGKANDNIVELYKTAYTALKGSSVGFDSVLAAAKNKTMVLLKAKLKKEIVDQPSIDFELKSLDGSMVKLSDLKGKVVVLDFWATWCGPCISSFPTLQKVYDKYKDNANIKILAINTWERVKPEEREQHVKNFIEKNKYTFPVLFDTDIVSKYGVEGIPTKFIIDQNGRIRFKDVGFGGAQEMEDKMNLQFEMLLSGDLSYTGK